MSPGRLRAVSDSCDGGLPAAGAGQDAQILRARSVLRAAGRIAIFSGAGLSTRSGIPDYRGPDGSWTLDPDSMRASHTAYYLAEAALRERSWQRRLASRVWEAKPNEGHRCLVPLSEQGRLAGVVTQNIDGLHQAAGLGPEEVVELHGTMWASRCLSCGERRPMGETLERVRRGEADPRCQAAGGRCGGVLSSDTVGFGERLDPSRIARAEEMLAAAEVVVAVGTSLSVHPAAGLVASAARSGRGLVICNASPTPYDGLAAALVGGDVSETLPALLAP